VPRGATAHEAPADSRHLFPEQGIHVVPLRVASGVRMKILEGWARGVPIAATPAATAGLVASDGALVSEGDPVALAAAIERLACHPEQRKAIVDAGRRALAKHHDPPAIGARWLELYRSVTR
jgi:glycosyltransferase involved in cell wall biosynthesis